MTCFQICDSADGRELATAPNMGGARLARATLLREGEARDIQIIPPCGSLAIGVIEPDLLLPCDEPAFEQVGDFVYCSRHARQARATIDGLLRSLGSEEA